MKNKLVYPAVFEKGEGGIGVSFPDLPGVVTVGDDIADALELAREALLFHLEGMLQDKEEFPAPSDPAALSVEDGCFVTLIDVPRPDKVERNNVTARSAEWVSIDRFAELSGKTRSGFMVDAALYMGGRLFGATLHDTKGGVDQYFLCVDDAGSPQRATAVYKNSSGEWIERKTERQDLSVESGSYRISIPGAYPTHAGCGLKQTMVPKPDAPIGRRGRRNRQIQLDE